jgi:hypothetical protein
MLVSGSRNAPRSTVAKHRSRTSQKQRHDEHVYYILEVLSWNWSFWFGVTPDPQRARDPYDDYRHLTVQGRFLRPAKLKERTIELIFIPKQELNQERRQNERPPPHRLHEPT